jgi:hypothetical protein
MASFTAGTTFVDGVSNDVTAAKLGALVTNATPTSGFIQDRTAETVVGVNDTLLIGDASDSNNLKRMTVANLLKAPLVSTSGTVDNLTTGTTTSTAQIVTSGTIATLNSTSATITTGTINTGTFGTTTSTAATITTGTIPTLVATTLVTTGTGTAAAPAIVPTGDTNTGIFFPAADTIAFSEGGTEGMRINSSGNVGIGTTSPATKLDVVGGRSTFSAASEQYAVGARYVSTGGPVYFGAASASATPDAVISGAGGEALMTLQNGGNVGIGTTSPIRKLSIDGGGLAFQSASGTNRSISWIDSTSTAAPVYLVGDSTSTGCYFAVNTSAFGTSGTERLRIDSSGNCSIGTATALSTLHVHGNVTLSNTTTATSAGTGGLSKPATYAGYLTVSINGTSRKIPYYAT